MKKLLLLLVLLLTFSCKSEKDYKQEALDAQAQIFQIAAGAEGVCSYYYTVWNNAISKSGSYWDESSPYYRKDFNEAIAVARKEAVVAQLIDSINVLQKAVDVKITSINKMPKKMGSLQGELLNSYANSKQFLRMAESPDGSLMSFTQTVNDLSQKAKQSDDRIKVLAQ